jgi:beta-aspartyl-dipeptidase (metallo-type)
MKIIVSNESHGFFGYAGVFLRKGFKMLTLLQNAKVICYTDLEKIDSFFDILIAGEKIAAIGKGLEFTNVPVETVDLEGRLLAPGFVDGHVHFIGAAGDEGYSSKTPEIFMSHFMRGGVTTAVGCLGFGIGSESLEQLYVKAQTLRGEGLSAYMYTGSFRMPSPSITGSPASDVAMLPWVIGVKIAIADGCSWHPTPDEFTRIAGESWVAGLQSGKSGVMQVHVGRHGDPFDFLASVGEKNGIPLTQFVPTHCNWSDELAENAPGYAKKGGYVDYSTILDKSRGSLTSVAAHKAVAMALNAGAPIERLSLSTDGNVGMPVRDEDNVQQGLYLERVCSLRHEIRALIKDGLDAEAAISLATINPARRLGLFPLKGTIKVGSDADLVVLDDSYEIVWVFSRGRVGFSGGSPTLFSLFEKDIIGTACKDSKGVVV